MRVSSIGFLAALLGGVLACGKGRDNAGTTTTTIPVAAEPLAAPVDCYAGPDGTAGVGVCHGGVQTFPDGPCLGQVTPTPEVCNGEDDDCNGTADDGLGTVTCGVGACEVTSPACADGKPGPCTPGAPAPETCDGIDNDCDGVVDEDCPCVYVTPGGDDAGAGTADRPLRTIAAGIRRAAEPDQPRRVCVAAAGTCPATSDYPEAVVMTDGYSVSGGYEASGTTWTRKGCVTRILAQDARGVVFDESIVRPTVLDGFTVVGGADRENAAITIEGSAGAVLTNDFVFGGAGETSYGVNVVAKDERPATPRILRSTVLGGRGSRLAVGIHAWRSAPVIQGNCSAYDARGRCVSSGCKTWSGFVRGRESKSDTIGQDSFAVRLEESAGSVVAQNAICAGGGAALAVGVGVSGAADGLVIRANHVVGTGARIAIGVLADGCQGASPWLFDNARLAGRSDFQRGLAVGVWATGDCHPRIDSNLLVAGNEGGKANGEGVHCVGDEVVGSRCVIEGNASIVGSLAGSAPMSTGIKCDSSCARIARNGRISGRTAALAVGVSLVASNALVDANVIEGGCSLQGSTGLFMANSASRVQNNVILGSLCPPGPFAPQAVYGIRVLVGPEPFEVDLHSNTVLTLGSPSPCMGRALAFEFAPRGVGSTRRGLVRNNILDGGLCERGLAVEERQPAAGPRVLENNDLWRATPAPVALYAGPGAGELRTIPEIEAVVGLQARGNISGLPLVSSAESPCRNAGTAVGAPPRDLVGHARPAEGRFDIGAHEFMP